MRIVDLSHVITSDMPVWPGTSPPEFSEICTIARDGFAEQSISISSHTGTHIDAPAHIIDGGASIDTLDIGRFFGKALLVDLYSQPGGSIPVEALRPFAPLIEQSDFLLLHTGWSRFWGQGGYDRDYPVLSAGAASWIAGFSLKGVGIDAPSFDLSGSDDYPVHRCLLAEGILLIENLTNLDRLNEDLFFLSVLPLGIVGAEASPVRAVALLEPFA
ncbi:MAG: cyclase family protein [Chlorobiaceae bacterium]|nr:cyclase family protein [Chlorobiaceae bacterium]